MTNKNKQDIINRMHEISGEPKTTCREFMNHTLKALEQLMIEADPEVKIRMTNFGSFRVKKQKGRKIPKGFGNEQQFKQSCRKINFRPGGKLKDTLAAPLVDLGYEPPEGAWDSDAFGGELEIE